MAAGRQNCRWRAEKGVGKSCVADQQVIAEVEDYVNLHQTAFGTKNMTVEWQARTLYMPHHMPETDLVVARPEDQPVAFCICWIYGDQGQVEPLGVHPDYERRGFGRSMLLEAFR